MRRERAEKKEGEELEEKIADLKNYEDLTGRGKNNEGARTQIKTRAHIPENASHHVPYAGMCD